MAFVVSVCSAETFGSFLDRLLACVCELSDCSQKDRDDVISGLERQVQALQSALVAAQRSKPTDANGDAATSDELATLVWRSSSS